jgi:hypothetical protein
MIDQAGESLNRNDFDIRNQHRFASIGGDDKNGAQRLPARQSNHRKHAAHMAHRTIERQLTDHQRLLGPDLAGGGQSAQENGSLGTDHGHGSVMMLLRGHVLGGKVHGSWPGLAEGQLVGPSDLAVTTDYRDVLGEVCLKRLNNAGLEQIFPRHAVRLPGIVTP